VFGVVDMVEDTRRVGDVEVFLRKRDACAVEMNVLCQRRKIAARRSPDCAAIRPGRSVGQPGSIPNIRHRAPVARSEIENSRRQRSLSRRSARTRAHVPYLVFCEVFRAFAVSRDAGRVHGIVFVGKFVELRSSIFYSENMKVMPRTVRECSTFRCP